MLTTEQPTGFTMDEPFEVVVIGAGFSGIGAGHKLNEAGIDDYIIVEQASKIGGTWRDNTYPGIRCDINLALYSYSWAPAISTEVFEHGGKIHEYLKKCVSDFKLEDKIKLNTKVTKLTWNEFEKLWKIDLEYCDKNTTGTIFATNIFCGTGLLTIPKYPPFFTKEDFNENESVIKNINKNSVNSVNSVNSEGSIRMRVAHTACWDRSSMSLKGKNVAVVGNGSSGIQVIESSTFDSKKMVCFQRSPKYLSRKQLLNIPSPIVKLIQAFPILLYLFRFFSYIATELMNVFITLPYLRHCPKSITGPTRTVLGFVLKYIFFVDTYTLQGDGVQNVCKKVGHMSDKKANIMQPKFTAGCNRVVFESDYFRALACEHCEVVNEGVVNIDTINRTISTTTRTFEDIDFVVLATGFEIKRNLPPFPIYGINGVALSEEWPVTPESLYGVSTQKFPNFYRLYGPHTNPLAGSALYFIECSINYSIKSLCYSKELKKKRRVNKISAVVKDEAVKDYYKNFVLKNMIGRAEFEPGCNSWYINNKLKGSADVYKGSTNFPGSMASYYWLTRNFDPSQYNYT